MMNRRELVAVAWYVLAWGVAISLGALALGGRQVGGGAAVGGLISLMNWIVLGTILHRASTWNDASRLAIVLAIKTMAALGAAAAAVLYLPVHAAGLVFGISSLFLGLATYGLRRLPALQADTEQGS